MKQRETYKLVVEREPNWWIVQIPELGLTTQARRLGDVDKNAREAIAALLDVGTASFDLEQDVRAPVAVVRELDEARALMDRAASLREESADRIGQAVEKLIKDFGLTMREAGKILDLSHQRIAQLVERARRGPRV
jgi:DNA gyrase/topoisomerase IV subunit A